MTIENQSLDQRLNTLDKATDDVAMMVQENNPMETTEDVLNENVVEQDPLQVADDPVFAEVEPTYVAGKIPKKVIETTEEIFSKNKDRDAAFKARQNINPISDDDYITIPFGDQPDAGDVLKSATGKKVVTAEGDTGVRNINLIDGPDSFKQFILTVSDSRRLDKTTFSTKEAMQNLTTPKFNVMTENKVVRVFDTEDAADQYIKKQGDKADMFEVKHSQPYSYDYITDLLDPSKKTIADPEYVGKMLVVQLDVVEQTRNLAREVVKAKESGELSPELVTRFDQMFALSGEISKAVEGRTADVGRSLRMFGELRKASGAGPEIEKYVARQGGQGDAAKRAELILRTDSAEEVAKMGRNRFSLENAPRMAKDIMYATWINGLLSSPITHMKNIIGNAVFGAWQIPERFIASAIGKGRKFIGQDVDTVKANEAMDFATGWFESWGDASRFATKSFKENRSLSDAGKVELESQVRADAFDLDFGDSEFGKTMTKGMRYYGDFVTLPGRFLTAEDEFFKGISYMAQIKSSTRRLANESYDANIASGMSKELADQDYIDYLANIRKNPPDELVKESIDMSKELTFTNELEGVMLDIQNSVNYGKLSPVLKMFFPFVRTPTNLAIQAAKRMPINPVKALSPSFYKSMMKGGRDADMALARVGLSSGILGTLAYKGGLAGNITGPGPKNFEQLKTFKAQGWQPFSFVLNKSDVSEDQLQGFRDMTPVSVGPDKIYVSYAGLQPIGSLLAIAGTMGEYAMLNSYQSTQAFSDDNTMQELVEAGTLGAYELLAQFPALTGVGDIIDIIEQGQGSTPDALLRLMGGIVQKGVEVGVGGTPFGAYGSLRSTIERAGSPEQSSILPPEGGEYAGFNRVTSGFWKSWQRISSTTPFYSDTLPARLDPITGEEVRVGTGNWGSAFNPFKTSEGKIHPAVETLLRYRVPMYSPKRILDGYELSAQQYNDWIYLATSTGELADEIVDTGIMLEYVDDLSKAQRKLRRTMTSKYNQVFPQLLEIYPELEMHMEGKDLESIEEGDYSYY
jgi:hypothetical protein